MSCIGPGVPLSTRTAVTSFGNGAKACRMIYWADACYRDPILDVIEELTRKKETMAAEKADMEENIESLGGSVEAADAAQELLGQFHRGNCISQEKKAQLLFRVWHAEVELQRRRKRRYKSRAAKRSCGRLSANRE